MDDKATGKCQVDARFNQLMSRISLENIDQSTCLGCNLRTTQTRPLQLTQPEPFAKTCIQTEITRYM